MMNPSSEVLEDKFTEEGPIDPWRFVTLEESAMLKSDTDAVVELLWDAWRYVGTTTIRARLAYFSSFSSSAYLVRSHKWNEMEEMYELMQRYAEDSHSGFPLYNNVVGAPEYTTKKLMESPEPGMVAMVKGRPEDGYVRAVVSQKVPLKHDKWKVMLLDFGDLMEVSGSDIFYLPHYFAQLPFTAIPVNLSNVHPILQNPLQNKQLLVQEGGFLPEHVQRVMHEIRKWAVKRFIELVLNKELVCKVDFQEGAQVKNKLRGRLYFPVEEKNQPSRLLNLSAILTQELKIKFPLFLDSLERILDNQERKHVIPTVTEQQVELEDHDSGVEVDNYESGWEGEDDGDVGGMYFYGDDSWDEAYGSGSDVEG